MSRTQTLSPGGVPQSGKGRFSSPLTALVVVAHEGIHPMNMFPPPMVALPRGTPRIPIALLILGGKGYSRGRWPVSRFPWMEKSVKLPRFLTHNGNSPDSRLFRRRRRLRLDGLPISGGIGPVRLLARRSRSLRLDRLPSSGGIGPVRLLPPSCSCCRLGRLPSSGGSVPFSPRVKREITVTRGGVPPVEIPCQLDIAVVAFQFSVAVPRRVSFSPQRTLQSAMSPVFV